MILYLFFIGILGCAASGLPVNCERGAELLPDANYCGWSNDTAISFACINGNVNSSQECDLGCLNGMCQGNDPAICSLSNYVRINPYIAGDCREALSQRADAVDVRLNYSYSTNLAKMLTRFFVGNLNPLSKCYRATFELACNMAYPSCGYYNKCENSFAIAITACGRNLTDINVEFCSYQHSLKSPDIFDSLLKWGLIALAICVALLLIVMFIMYYNKLRTSSDYSHVGGSDTDTMLQGV